MSGQIQPSFIGRYIRNVTAPDCIRGRNLELLAQQILSYRQLMLRIGGRLKPLLLLAAQTLLSLDTLDPADPYLDAMLGQVAL